MPRLTVTISDEHEQILEEHSNGEAFRSKSEVVRECIEAHERVDELTNQMACLEAEVNMLREQRHQLKEKAARVDELETKLRKLQMEYHTLIKEGKSPTELEPKLDTSIATEQETTAESETVESPATTLEATSKTEISRASDTTETVETVSSAGTDVGSPSTTASNETDTSKTSSAGVEIDEELLYQSSGVGSRLKSALFGGPGGSH